LNRRQQEKAKRKALRAEIRQLLEQNAVPRVESDDFYNFIDENKIRHIAVTPELRGRLIRGEIVIVRHDGRYHFVPAAAAVRIRERDGGAVIIGAPQRESGSGAQEPKPVEDDPYRQFSVPDDLIW
jgi:uncharacterized protein YaiL (DUF2058 family)